MNSHKILDIQNKKLKQIRKQDRQKIFSSNRAWGNEAPIILIIPALLKQSNYQNFDMLLDSIEQSQLHLVNQKFKQCVYQAWNKEANQQHRLYLFRLINRLKITNNNWLRQAVDFIQKLNLVARDNIFKEIAIYLEDNQRDNQKQKIYQQLFEVIISFQVSAHEINYLEYTSFILSQLMIPSNFNHKKLLHLIEIFLQTYNEFIQSKAFEIISKLELINQIGLQLIKISNFGKIIDLGLNPNASFEFLVPAIDICSGLIAGNDYALNQLVTKYNIVHYLSNYKDHMLDEIRRKVYWSLSNISANQVHYRLITPLLTQIHTYCKLQNKYKIKCQMIFTILNWCCNTNTDDIQTKQCQKWLPEFIVDVLKENNIFYLQRILFGIFNIVDKAPIYKHEFDKLSLTPLLQNIYNLKNSNQIEQMIQKVLQKIKVIKIQI